ncbi:MAG: hypothetical protein HZB46_01315 [Solirubrobacterales bacterium]|nr:hypothetical protein [Solirubrobacterales bacterium]
MLAAIEWGKLGELLYVAPIAGIVVAVTYAFVILGLSRAGDSRRNGAAAAATFYGLVALVAGAAFIGSVVYAISIIVSK